MLVEGGIDVQLGISEVHPDPAEAATNTGSSYSLTSVAQGQSKAVPEIDLHQSSSQEAPDTTH